MEPNSFRVVVLAGGTSPEREVSLQGGWAVERALKQSGLETEWLDPSETPVLDFSWQVGDVAFLVLHGEFGEDGQVQSLLESRNIPYTGSDALASKIAFRKSATKERLQLAHVPTPDSVIISRGDSWESLQHRAASLGYPLVVKPDAQGSSLGVTVVFKEQDLQEAIERCFALDRFGLMERYIAGSEWTVGLWNDQALPPICIETPRGFYDYAAKYTDEETQYHFEAEVPAVHLERLKRIAVRVGQSVGTRGIARVDFRLNADWQPWVLEINTIPGMTDHSLIPKAAARVGIEFPELCERIVRETATQRRSQSAA
ncbi:MAG: D-alanine--D-alanine ligase [Planctomycetaceae bacterium]|nr:D-alanine--D-alanine ligase [Planctomycetaceae bacterium]